MVALRRRKLTAAAGLAALAVAASWPLLPPGSARAAMLEAEECAKLKSEEAELTKAGVRGYLSRGPAWAKSNLDLNGVERVRRLIAVDEQIAFRCPRPPPPKPTVAQGEAPPAAAKKGKAKSAKADPNAKAAAAPPPAEAAAKPKPKPKPKPVAAEPEAAAAKPEPKPKSAAPKVARPKADDAFSPTGATPKRPEASQQ